MVPVLELIWHIRKTPVQCSIVSPVLAEDCPAVSKADVPLVELYTVALEVTVSLVPPLLSSGEDDDE